MIAPRLLASIFASLLLLASQPAIADEWADIEAAHLKGDDQTALRLAIDLAEKGDARAQGFVGFLYSMGKGIKPNPAIAVSWLRRAAMQGEPAAQANLCSSYLSGDGVVRDTAQAAHWCQLSADQGNEFGQYILGGLYATGQGVAQDFVQAYKWLALSQAWASQTNQRDLAAEGLARAEAQLTPAQLEVAKRLAADWKPSQP